jgi:hypothetical protein
LVDGPAMAQFQDIEVLRRNNIEMGKLPSDAESERLVRQAAFCAIDDARAKRILRAYPASTRGDEELYYMLYGASTCDRARLQFSARFSRGPVAEYKLKRDFDLANWTARGKAADVYSTPTNEQLAKLSAETRSEVVMTEIGTCVAQASPTQVAALLMAEPRTSEENAAFSAIMPALAGCIPPAVEMKISKFRLRGYLAEGAYRYAAAKDRAAK